MTDAPQGASLTAAHTETAQGEWERILETCRARYPETVRLLETMAEADRIYQATVRAMHPTRYWTSDHANMTDQAAS